MYLRENAEFWLSNSKILYECAYVEDVFLYMYLLYLLHTYAANVPIDYHFRSRIHDLCKVLICLFCSFLFSFSTNYIYILFLHYNIFSLSVFVAIRNGMHAEIRLTSLKNNSLDGGFLYLFFMYSDCLNVRRDPASIDCVFVDIHICIYIYIDKEAAAIWFIIRR